MVSKLVSIPSKITSTRQTVISTARMTPYVFLVADNTPFATFTSAVFVPACQMHVFTWQFLFLFRIYFATVPTDMVAYMWNTDRNTVFVRVIDILDVTAAPPQETCHEGGRPRACNVRRAGRNHLQKDLCVCIWQEITARRQGIGLAPSTSV